MATNVDLSSWNPVELTLLNLRHFETSQVVRKVHLPAQCKPEIGQFSTY